MFAGGSAAAGASARCVDSAAARRFPRSAAPTAAGFATFRHALRAAVAVAGSRPCAAACSSKAYGVWIVTGVRTNAAGLSTNLIVATRSARVTYGSARAVAASGTARAGVVRTCSLGWSDTRSVSCARQQAAFATLAVPVFFARLAASRKDANLAARALATQQASALRHYVIAALVAQDGIACQHGEQRK